jgi:hypothetical protein
MHSHALSDAPRSIQNKTYHGMAVESRLQHELPEHSNRLTRTVDMSANSGLAAAPQATSLQAIAALHHPLGPRQGAPARGLGTSYDVPQSG